MCHMDRVERTPGQAQRGTKAFEDLGKAEEWSKSAPVNTGVLVSVQDYPGYLWRDLVVLPVRSPDFLTIKSAPVGGVIDEGPILDRSDLLWDCQAWDINCLVHGDNLTQFTLLAG